MEYSRVTGNQPPDQWIIGRWTRRTLPRAWGQGSQLAGRIALLLPGLPSLSDVRHHFSAVIHELASDSSRRLGIQTFIGMHA
jgi:hypothetical protein